MRFALGQPQAQVTLGGLQLEHVAVEQRTAQFDLTLTVGEGPDGILRPGSPAATYSRRPPLPAGLSASPSF